MTIKTKVANYAGLLFLSAIWGSSFLFIKLSIETIHPSFLTFLRLLIASFFLYLYLKIVKKKILSFNKNFKYLLLIALFGNVIPFNLISWCEIKVDSVIVAILIGTMPFFTFLISHYFFKFEKINLAIVIGLILGFLGMSLIVKESGYEDITSENLNYYLNIVIIFSAMCYAFAANCVNKIKNVESIEIATTTTVIATVISLPIYFLLINYPLTNLGYSMQSTSFKSLISCFFLGFMCTGVAILVFFNLIKKESPGFASQSNFFIPCFGLLWSYLFLNENINLSIMVNLVLIVAGVLFVHRGRRQS